MRYIIPITIVFVILKVSEVIMWSWWLVLSPIIALVIYYMIVTMILGTIALVILYNESKDSK